MSKIKAVNGAGKAFYANHLAANDYYSEHERIEGVWRGELSVDFKLYGATVETEIFSLFQLLLLVEIQMSFFTVL